MPVQPLPMLPAVAVPSPEATPVPDLGVELTADPVVDRPHLRDARPPARGGGVLPIAAWIVSLILFASLVGAAYAWRAQIMAAWPPSERLYAALGLARPASDAPPPPTGH